MDGLRGLARRESVERTPTYGKTHGYEGTILQTADDIEQRIKVKLSNPITGRATWGPCRWEPRFTIGSCGTGCSGQCALVLFPQAGDECLVAMSDEREPWIVQWWPYG